MGVVQMFVPRCAIFTDTHDVLELKGQAFLTKASRYSLDVSLANHNEIVQKVIESIFHGSHRIEIILSYVISPVHCLQSHSFLHHFEKSLSGDRQIRSNLPIYERAPFQLLSLAVLTVFRISWPWIWARQRIIVVLSPAMLSHIPPS